MAAPPADNYKEYTLLDYLSVARKRWIWIAVPVLLLGGLAAFYSISQEDRFEATAGVLLADSAAQRTLDPASQNTGFLSRELSNEIKLATSDKVEILVAERLGELPEMTVDSDPEADMLVFTSSSATADRAAVAANTWAEMYIDVKQDEAVRTIDAAIGRLSESLEALRIERQTLRAPLDEIDDRISAAADPEVAAGLQRDYDRLADDLRYELELLDNRAASSVSSLTELELQAGLSAVGEAQVIEVAEAPDARSNAPLARTVAAGVVGGLVLGLALALLAEMRDNTIKSAADVAAITDLPVLASVPEANKRDRKLLGMATAREPDGVYADSYQKLRSSLEFLSLEGLNDEGVKSVMITSPSPSEGKSTTSANLALAMSSVGRRTVLVDLDFRRATVHKIFGIHQSPGLSDFVLHGADLSRIAYALVEPGLEDLLVVPTGTVPPNPASFVGTRRFLTTIDWLESQADVVLLDTPPLLAVSDAHTISKHVDAVVVTARVGSTTKAEMLEVIGAMRQVGANLVGIVLIGVDEAESYGKRYYQADAVTDYDAGPPPGVNGGDLWSAHSGRQVQPPVRASRG